MKLHQIKLSYEPQQDRLLARVSTVERTEYRFWLTRRMVKRLWPALIKVMQTTPLARQAPATARPAILDFQREEALRQNKFGEPYAEDLQPALPGEPMLVTQASLRRGERGISLELAPATGSGVHLLLTEALLHGFSKLLQDALRGTDWDCALPLPESVSAAVAKPN